jgi:hypothetical protein
MNKEQISRNQDIVIGLILTLILALGGFVCALAA